ncbi:MAG: hypothetical protein NT154_00740 [Verrucomicrobia bacterium]|nr:hypothetical protein [Verrucomicrobiota bacterium]
MAENTQLPEGAVDVGSTRLVRRVVVRHPLHEGEMGTAEKRNGDWWAVALDRGLGICMFREGSLEFMPNARTEPPPTGDSGE